MGGEAHALRRHAVEVRGANLGLTVTADISIAKVIGQNKHDVRPSDCGRLHGRSEQEGSNPGSNHAQENEFQLVAVLDIHGRLSVIDESYT
jgi:hypothetical protein